MINYQKELEKLLSPVRKLPIQHPDKKILLHSCCAPCSSYVLSYLRSFFNITLFYYNPNITAAAEYAKRVEEQKRLIEALNRNGRYELESEETRNGFVPGHITFLEGGYEPERFYETVKGYEQCKEGGERCFRCYALRLKEAAVAAKETGADYFTTTLTISPLKNAEKLNQIGQEMALEYGVSFLPSDFKKKNGYKRSIELSREYDLYRQDYCGCAYSLAQREQEKQMEK